MLTSFNTLYIQQVYIERIGCFSVEKKPILQLKDSPRDIVKACSSAAWSLGLKMFAVRNENECLADKHLPSILPQLNASKGCRGGRGGKSLSDVYRLTSKKTSTQYNLHLLFNPVATITFFTCSLFCPAVRPFTSPSSFVCSFRTIFKTKLRDGLLSSFSCLKDGVKPDTAKSVNNRNLFLFFFTSVFVSKLTGLTTSKVTFKSVRVDWNPVSEPFIIGYKIFVQNISLLVPSNETHAHVGGLNSNTSYILSVLPLHGLTDEENSAKNAESIIITTKPELGK